MWRKVRRASCEKWLLVFRAAQIKMLHGLHRARRRRAWRNLTTNFFIAVVVVPVLLFGLRTHSRLFEAFFHLKAFAGRLGKW